MKSSLFLLWVIYFHHKWSAWDKETCEMVSLWHAASPPGLLGPRLPTQTAAFIALQRCPSQLILEPDLKHEKSKAFEHAKKNNVTTGNRLKIHTTNFLPPPSFRGSAMAEMGQNQDWLGGKVADAEVALLCQQRRGVSNPRGVLISSTTFKLACWLVCCYLGMLWKVGAFFFSP